MELLNRAVLLCMLRVIGSIVFVDTHRNHPARECGSRARDRVALWIIASRRIVDSVEYHDCNQSPAARAAQNFEIHQTIRVNLFFFFFSPRFFLSSSPLLFLSFFVFFFLRSRRL